MPDERFLPSLLAKMEGLGASDLHIKAGSPPIFRIKGVPQRVKAENLTPERAEEVIREILREREINIFDTTGSVDFAHQIPDVGRFRINVFRQRGLVSFAARRVNSRPPTLEELTLPPAMAKLTDLHDGLVLVAVVTGSGKTTTLAALIEMINQKERCHILTIEDPIEFVYSDAKAFISQREVGVDVPSFPVALKYAMREDPDVILVGEMRDPETVEAAIAASETGHLVFGTLHSTNAMQTVTRILEFFPPDRQPSIRAMMSYIYRAAIVQRLMPSIRPERPRVPALEIMFVDPVIRKHIADGEDVKIPKQIRAMARDGMQDFNMALFNLVKEGWITEEIALSNSSQPEQLHMQFRGMVLNADAT